MGANFQLTKYDMKDYHVFRLEANNKKEKNPSQIGFAIIELKNIKITCPKCKRETKIIQTWWHNKLPFKYISGQIKELDISLCLDCAVEENYNGISDLKNNYNKNKNNHSLLAQYEINNEQIEYYKLYKAEQEKLLPAY